VQDERETAAGDVDGVALRGAEVHAHMRSKRWQVFSVS
jgi:hypothetical protein